MAKEQRCLIRSDGSAFICRNIETNVKCEVTRKRGGQTWKKKQRGK